MATLWRFHSLLHSRNAQNNNNHSSRPGRFEWICSHDPFWTPHTRPCSFVQPYCFSLSVFLHHRNKKKKQGWRGGVRWRSKNVSDVVALKCSGSGAELHHRFWFLRCSLWNLPGGSGLYSLMLMMFEDQIEVGLQGITGRTPATYPKVWIITLLKVWNTLNKNISVIYLFIYFL